MSRKNDTTRYVLSPQEILIGTKREKWIWLQKTRLHNNYRTNGQSAAQSIWEATNWLLFLVRFGKEERVGQLIQFTPVVIYLLFFESV